MRAGFATASAVALWRAALLAAPMAMAAAVAAAAATSGSHNAGDTATGSAVVLLYHHVADDTPASTSVTPQRFAAHLAYLKRHDYQVVPLSRIISAVTSGTPLPARAVAITFDDGYRSVYEHAAPLLHATATPSPCSSAPTTSTRSSMAT